MHIISIEPTPSPNVMKLTMNETLPEGVSRNYSRDDKEKAPADLQPLLEVEGVRGVFQVNDFIAVERHPKADWKEVLAQIAPLFGAEVILSSIQNESAETSFGEIFVFLQTFQGIPMQVKLMAGTEERRYALPQRFSQAVMKLQAETANHLLLVRKWEEQGVRYGTFDEVGQELVEEIGAAYDQERLDQLVEQGKHKKDQSVPEKESLSNQAEKEKLLDHPDWEKRFQALERINPTHEDIPILAKALQDSKTSIRRLATVYLGMINQAEVLPHLYQALLDKSAAVRRTAGDALSDMGDPRAILPMTKMLKDPNKLVRWRAARFLYEVGDDSAIPALLQAEHDPEFEVSLQAKMALERIERGEEASGTVWQQMTRNQSNQKE